MAQGTPSEQYNAHLQKITASSSKHNSGTERILLLTPIFFVSTYLDYNENNNMLKVRVAYSVVQVFVIIFVVYIMSKVNRQKDFRRIYVPDLSFLSVQNPNNPKIFKTSYYDKEMIACTSLIRQHLFAALVTGLLHDFAGLNIVLLVQIFMTPYNVLDSRIFKKHIFGIGNQVRVWNELFRSELSDQMVVLDGDQFGKPTKKERFEGKQNALLKSAWDKNSAELFESFMQTISCHEMDSRTEEGWTALMVGCGIGNVPITSLKLLIDWGADLALQDSDGWTALHWACHHKNEEAVKLICSLHHEKNELLNVKSKDGLTAGDVAYEAGASDLKTYMTKIPIEDCEDKSEKIGDEKKDEKDENTVEK